MDVDDGDPAQDGSGGGGAEQTQQQQQPQPPPGRENSSTSSSTAAMETLFSAFGCMQTLDKKDLIEQVRRLIGDANITDAAALFYLEMNQYNVSAAVGSYFDLETGAEANAQPSQMTFIRDVTIGEGEAVPPDTTFIKTWQVQNTSATDTWPEGVKLCFTQGHEQLLPPSLSAGQRSVPVKSLLPYQRTDISVELRSPSDAGIYQSKWRMSTASGLFFGDTIWVIITVEPTGTMALTQQMNNFKAFDTAAVVAGGGGAVATNSTTATAAAAATAGMVLSSDSNGIRPSPTPPQLNPFAPATTITTSLHHDATNNGPTKDEGDQEMA